MKLNTILYENPHTHYLMQERGIKRPNEKIEDVFRRVIVSLVHEDLQLDNMNTIDAGFLEQLLFFTNKKIIVYGTPHNQCGSRGGFYYWSLYRFISY